MDYWWADPGVQGSILGRPFARWLTGVDEESPEGGMVLVALKRRQKDFLKPSIQIHRLRQPFIAFFRLIMIALK